MMALRFYAMEAHAQWIAEPLCEATPGVRISTLRSFVVDLNRIAAYA